jgi:hypothetical protein
MLFKFYKLSKAFENRGKKGVAGVKLYATVLVFVVFMMHKNTLNYGNFDLAQWLILYERSYVVRQKNYKGQ